jgi:hypothetical protein
VASPSGVTDRDWADAHLINAAIDIHHGDPEFGYRFIADELPARGVTAGGTASAGCAPSSGRGRRTRRSAR